MLLSLRRIYNQYSGRIYLLTMLLAIQGFNCISQEIHGTITGGPGSEPLPAVSVIVDDTIGIFSDSLGHYSISLSVGKHAVLYKQISYSAEKRTIELAADQSLELNIQLNLNTQFLGTVVVSAGKFEQRLSDVTVSMEVLKPDLIEKRNTILMDEAMDHIPGVTVIDGQANIRGGSGWSYGAGSRVQVLVDDLPQLTADASDTKWNFLPIENLEQVEVIKGASSVLFGSSALNGVINIRTAFPRDTPLTKVATFVGFYDDATITTDKTYSLKYQEKTSFFRGLNFFHSRKIGRLDLVAGGSAYNDDGYRQGEHEKRGRINFNTRYRFKVPGLSAGMNVNAMSTKATIYFLWLNDTSGAYQPAPNTLSDLKSFRINVDPFVTYIGPNEATHRFRSRWFNSTNDNNTNQDSRGDLFYFEYQFQKKFYNRFTITSGLVRINSIVHSELYGDHDGHQNAAYLQGDVKWKKFTASLGARVEESKVDSILDKWTPVVRAGVNYRAFRETYFRASAGQGYRFPSIAERFIQTNVSGATIYPNPELEPEKGASYEIGIRQGMQIGVFEGYIDVAVFQNEYENMMEFAFAQWQPGQIGFKSVNVGNTRIRGFEAVLSGQFPIDARTKITLQGGYTYIDPRQLTYDSAYVKKVGLSVYMGSDSTDFLKYRSRHTAKGDIEVSRGKFAIGMSVRYNSRIENIDKIFVGGIDLFFPPGLGIGDYRSYHTGGDIVFDLRLAVQVTKALHVSVISKNVFNHIYMQRPADMQPPRTWTLQAGVKF